MQAQWQVHAPFGAIWLVQRDECLAQLRFCAAEDVPLQHTPLLGEAQRQLTEYFARKRRTFDLPLAPVGTPFQRAVWQALTEIPYGQTRTYGDIARQIGRPKACRAVGMANHNNPISIMIPCHRVIGANGALTGYGGGLNIKKFLLELENEV